MEEEAASGSEAEADGKQEGAAAEQVQAEAEPGMEDDSLLDEPAAPDIRLADARNGDPGALSPSIKYTLRSHLRLIRCLVLVIRVSIQYHGQTLTEKLETFTGSACTFEVPMSNDQRRSKHVVKCFQAVLPSQLHACHQGQQAT